MALIFAPGMILATSHEPSWFAGVWPSEGGRGHHPGRTFSAAPAGGDLLLPSSTSAGAAFPMAVTPQEETP